MKPFIGPETTLKVDHGCWRWHNSIDRIHISLSIAGLYHLSIYLENCLAKKFFMAGCTNDPHGFSAYAFICKRDRH